METTFLRDDFVTTRPGEPYRLFPYGRIVKGGRLRTITPEYAARIRLPHFKPPIKLGSHKEETPAGGHIIGLEVRADGLYAIPALNERGEAAVREGHYRYQSPEIMWDDGYLEHPETGEKIQGPLIVGDALLHTPHLGEAAALYSVEMNEGDETMSDGTMTIPASLGERFNAWLDRLIKDVPPGGQPPGVPEDYAALQAKAAEVDQLATRIATMEIEAAKQARLSHFAAEVGKTKVAQDGAAEHLASMPEATAAWVLQQFAALSAQIDEGVLLSETGVTGGPVSTNATAAFNSLVTAKMKEKGIDYNTALVMVTAEQPDAFHAYINETRGGK